MFTVAAERPGHAPALVRGVRDTGYYYVVLAFFVVIALVMAVIQRSRFGRVLRGMSNSPVAVATMGLSTNTTRVIVFCISAFFAGIGGILYGSSIHFAVSSDAHFMPLFSLILLALLAVAPFADAVVRPAGDDRRRPPRPT